MGWKEFFKPTLGKVILFIILMGGLNYQIISSTHVLDGMSLAGAPFGFYPVGGYFVQIGQPPPPSLEFSYANFAVDIVFWYLISCVLAAWYKSHKRLGILAMFLSSAAVLILWAYLFINLTRGSWKWIPAPIITLLFTALFFGAYFYLLNRLKFFGLRK